MIFYIDNEVNAEFDFDIEELVNEVAEEVLKGEGFTYDAEVSLIITDDEGIQEDGGECGQANPVPGVPVGGIVVDHGACHGGYQDEGDDAHGEHHRQ